LGLELTGGPLVAGDTVVIGEKWREEEAVEDDAVNIENGAWSRTGAEGAKGREGSGLD
jgi:hypothetical protein